VCGKNTSGFILMALLMTLFLCESAFTAGETWLDMQINTWSIIISFKKIMIIFTRPHRRRVASLK
jgi:hypothetical protein